MKKTVFLLATVLIFNFAAFASQGQIDKSYYDGLKKLSEEQKYPLYYAESFMALCKDWENTKLMYFVADGYDKLGNLYREKDILLRALKLTPNDKKLKAKLDDTQARIDEIEKKIEVLEQKPQDLQVYLQLAAIYIGLKDLTNARKYLNKANGVDHSKSDILHRIYWGAYQKQIEIPTKKAIEISLEALRQYEKGNKEKAYTMFRDALSLSISSPFVYDNLSKMLIKEKNYGGAIRALEESFATNKDVNKALDLGNLYFLMGDYNTAFNYFQQATQLNGNSTEAYYNIALCLEKLGDKEGAKKYYEIAFHLKPELKKLKNKKTPLTIEGIKIETGKTK